ncbi:hypothetical protein TVAG_010570 [Trichomonas vaginalis G3]|uniref:Uncharacterized protein n=1 Tax=Trichomonas vaginalis (strain ATCC PRA-98 / G3) TaxID=412133 RepID=A2DNY4_TRIV3|nr:transcription initiation from RNA polymerase II promoter [Trichomonas vaginalis G3]EAY17833.1 hypothetical protein TVAG_010570 [Trichomonas vaginalis G3]KAI5489966.1 transcription initiation from RNA polymerase II promoter [Trichomonas vaginalis G3]|eukprot:XP_001329968.1 hypothetical protein [Trichomonas vaginalis G3]
MFEPEELFVVESPAWTVDLSGSAVTAIDYSIDGAFVAYSNKPGIITIATSYTGEIKRVLEQKYTTNPITKIRFHPFEENLLICTSKDGFIFLYNIVKGEMVEMSRHLGSNLLAMNVDSFGETFAIACADGSIRVYDLENLQRTKVLVKMASRTSASQQVNIYDICFHPEDSNVILAAGWNDRVLYWDVRTGNAERNIAGPHIRGAGLDVHNDTIITASARDKKQIEMWDYGSGKKLREININPETAKKECYINACKVSRNGLALAAGGSGCNLTQSFEFSHGTYIGQTAPYSSPVSYVAVSPFGSSFVTGTENGDISCHMIRLKPN